MITLTLPLPPSANRYWRVFRNRVVMSSEARQYKIAAGYTAKAAGHHTPLTGDVRVRIRVFRKIKSGDLDNKIKVVLDAFNGILWADDNQVVEILAYRYDDKKNPRVEIEVDKV